ncbi:MAG: NAD-dependent succinate-semialdehyde dehydrogenase [Robiginitomaculum sp.]|nr:NAD-dependent succinate-semialdehyde dehydrogenase [Robiginitomaculum sp.]
MSERNLLKQQAYIDGQWMDALSGETIAVNNPANGNVIAHVPKMGAKEARTAIEAAAKALANWRAKTGKARAVILRRWYELIMQNQEDLAQILSLEQGKPLAEARGEIAYGASFIEWFSEEAKRTYGETIPGHMPGARLMTIKQPVGVVAAITPWNFPNAMITRKAGAALAAGCTMVVKPAEQTPLSALALAVLSQEAGIPAGVFSVITGDPVAIGGELTKNHLVRKLTFTGSTATGQLLMRQCADTVKKISLELGGNAPFIVLDDADVDKAAAGAILCKFRNTGQTCVCANRLYVQSGVYDAFIEKFAALAANLTVGVGQNEDSDLGPLIDEAALAKVQSHLSDALAKGACVETGGEPHALGGLFFEPTVLRNASQDMLIAREETFGPLAPVIKFETDTEVLAMANDTHFGLASYLFTSNINRAYTIAEGLEAGMVGINTGLISTELAPFGGIKQSGLGREGGRQGIEEYLETKYICLDIEQSS